MASCPYCGVGLAPGPPWAPGEDHRLAYDPLKGRLWNVCPGCARWVLTPLEDRWETLDACERAVSAAGRIRLSTPHLSLIQVEEGQLIRVGEPHRREFVEWRYGDRLSGAGRRRSFWARLLDGLPTPPVGGYDPYRGLEGAFRSEPWFTSPFLDKASPLTYLFSHVPLAPSCPSCGNPLALKPWDFQRVEILSSGGAPAVMARCGLCTREVNLPLAQARPALRMGLGLVTNPGEVRRLASSTATELDERGGPMGFIEELASSRVSMGDLPLSERAGLIISLDELAEMEALEGEWRRAEEMAAIMDGELSEIPGFDDFRREILEGNG